MSDWRNRDAGPISKVADVVSLNFNFLVYFSLHIIKAKSRNEQLRYYEGNWATYEILKRFFKSRRCYKKRITSANDDIGSDLDSKDMISDNDVIIHGESDGEGDNDGNSDGDREGKEDGNGDGDRDGEGDKGDDDGEKSANSDDDDAVDSWNGKGKGKAKEGSTGSKRRMPQEVGKSKKMRL